MSGEQDLICQGISAALQYIIILLCHTFHLKRITINWHYLRLDLRIANISVNCALILTTIVVC